MVMQTSISRPTLILSAIVTLLAAVASAGGLLIKDLYRDNAFVKQAWYTNDIIILFVAAPLLLLSIYLSNQGSLRWKLIWISLLGYTFYNFAFYLFGAAFNIFFLIYTALFSLSGFTLLQMLWQISTEPVNEQFSEKTPVKWISAYLMLMPVMLFIAELGMIVPFLTSGILPETIITTGHPTGVVFALDFSIIIPAFIASAILLWQRKSWGYILAVMMLVKGFTYGLVLCIGTAVLAYNKAYGKWDPLMPLYFVLAAGGGLGCWLLLKKLSGQMNRKVV
jgi:hypothetical protein